jgi:hypothetical protein
MFRCESILLRSHWVMVVMDVFTRRVIGFGVERADPCGVSVCRMFNQIIAGKSLPQHLSSNPDPLFRFHRLSMLKTSMWRERLEIFAPSPYRGGHDHDDFRFRFAALVPLS